MEREQVDRAALPVDRERDLDLRQPPRPAQPTGDLAHEECVALVEQPIGRATTPRHVTVEAGIDRPEDPAQRPKRQPVEMAPLDERDRRLGDPGQTGDVDLAKASPMPEGPKQPAGPLVIHWPMMAWAA